MRTSILSLLLILSFLTGYAQTNGNVSSVTDTTVFTFCDVMPSIKTKEYKSFEQYLLKNTISPNAPHSSGFVVVEFIIEKDGSVSNIKIITSLDPVCDQEAIRVISGCPKWNPGMQNGKLVRLRKRSKFNFN